LPQSDHYFKEAKMTNETNPPAEPEEVIISPTILYRRGRGTLEAVTVNRGDGHTMLVFRSEEEAEKFRSHTGLYSEASGFRALSVDHEQLRAFLEAHGCTHVAMPEAWTAQGGVDRFEADAFIGMLEESVSA
jgi:hypothetical protein